jgi:quercetin dioxygenase-like cupin family protein
MKLGANKAAVLGILIMAASCAPENGVGQKAPGGEKALAIAADDPNLTWGPCPDLFPGDCSIAVLHGDPAADNADVFLKVAPNYEVPAHWHTSPERMTLVSGELHVTYQGQPTVALNVGDYAYGPARLPHRATCVSATPCTLFIAFESAIDAHAFDGNLD